MLITNIESERLLLRRVATCSESCSFGVFARATGELLGSANLEPAEDGGGWSIGVWLDDDDGCAAEVLAALTRVCIETLHAERAEIFAHADDTRSARIFVELGYRWRDRARAGDEGPIVDRWVTTSTAGAIGLVPRLRLAGDLGATVPPPAPELAFAGLGGLPFSNYAD